MRKLTSYGPSLIVLVTAAMVLLAGPRIVRQLAYEQTKTKIVQARLSLADQNVLQQINQAYRDIATAVEPSVVHVSADYVEQDVLGNDRVGTSAGSGWVFDDLGHIVTNHHVIQNAQRIEVQLYNGEIRPAELVGSDATTDVAVLKIAPARLHAAELAEPRDMVSQGDLVFAFGSPFDFRFSMSSGVVSGKDRSVGVIRDETGKQLGYENFIQVDAAINPGNSGGPLTDYRGRVIGMNTAIATSRRAGSGGGFDEGQFAGIGLAIPMEMVRPVVKQLIEKGFVEKGFLGVDPRDLTASLAQELGFVGNGVVIVSVDADGPAGRAGVLPGDVVTEVAGQTVTSREQLRSIVSSMSPGDTVALAIWRHDKASRTSQKLGLSVPLNRLDTIRAFGKLPPDHPNDSIVSLGIARMSTCTPETAARLGVKRVPGVLIEDIVPDSTLSRVANVGCVIDSVMDRRVADVNELFDGLAAYDLRGGVRLGLVEGNGRRSSVIVRPK